MDLYTRLKQIHGKKERPTLPSNPTSKPVPIFEGKEVENERGAFFLRRKKYPLDREVITSLERLEIEPSLFSLEQGDLTGVSLEDLLFIDTETTGLAGGTGTVPFMVGIGYCRNKMFHVKQFLIRDYHEEEALLFSLGETLRGFTILVSFNGKSFDLPLLKTRFILHGLSFPWKDYLSLDLLIGARRLWKRRIGGCALQELEREILGLSRGEDVEGYMIPSIFFSFLQSRKGDLLRPIFLHNGYDLLSMASLLSIMVQCLNLPEEVEHGLDLFSQAKFFEKVGDGERAVRLYHLSIERGLAPPIHFQVKKELSLLYKRSGAYEEAVKIWESMIECRGDSLFPYVELAKYYEHHSRHLQKAYYYTDLARRRVQKKRFLYQRGEDKELRHRLNRIERKMDKEMDKERSLES